MFKFKPSTQIWISKHPYKWRPIDLKLEAIKMKGSIDAEERNMAEEILTWLDETQPAKYKKDAETLASLLIANGLTTRAKAAVTLQYSPRAVAYWIAGEKQVPYLVWHFLKSELVLKNNGLTLDSY